MTAMPAVPLSFEQFQAQSLAGGFGEVLVREGAPGQVSGMYRAGGIDLGLGWSHRGVFRNLLCGKAHGLDDGAPALRVAALHVQQFCLAG